MGKNCRKFILATRNEWLYLWIWKLLCLPAVILFPSIWCVKIFLWIVSLNKFNTFTPNHVYLRPTREKLLLLLQTLLSEKPKKCRYFFTAFSESTLNLQRFWKKNWASWLKYFWNYWLRKTSLLKCIKCPVSENPSIIISFI